MKEEEDNRSSRGKGVKSSKEKQGVHGCTTPGVRVSGETGQGRQSSLYRSIG